MKARLPLGHLGYWAAALVIGLMGWTLYNATQGIREASRWVAHTLEVLDHVSNIDEAVARADGAHRGYLLNGEARFADEREAALSRLSIELGRTRALTADNPAQQRRLRELEELIAKRVEIMRENALLRDVGGVAAVATRNTTGRGQEASTRIYELTAQIDGEEQRLLGARRAAEQADYDHMFFILWVSAAVAITVMLPGYLGFVLEARARRRAEAKMLDMANSLPGAVYRLRTLPGGERRFEFLSSGVEPLRGVDLDAAMSDFSAMWRTIVEDDRALVTNAMAAAERDLQPTQYDFRVKQPDGSVKWLRACATLRKERDGSVLWNGYWSDVTRERRLQNELHEAMQRADSASRAKSTFLATMSHEIRTPMNGVLGMLELLSLTHLDGEQRTTLGVIRESGRSLLRIIDDILDFSKIEAGKLEVRPEVASVRDLVGRVCNIYSGNASSKGLLLMHHVDPRISPAVVVDPLRLQQILNNFVSNAIKFTNNGEVEVRADLVEARDGEEVVRFTVSDTGIGVSAKDKERLFTPFSQASDTANRHGGTGLGLAICRRLAEMMRGTVEMQSELGKGTSMVLTLPLPVAEAQAIPASQSMGAAPAAPLVSRSAPPSPDAAREAGTLILVVDDHPINRMVLVKQVNALGHAAEAAENGLEGLDLWSRGGVAVVITDCNMPGMNGYELARHIRACEARNGHARAPIIACTANALGGEAENCFAAGMDDYLAKPIDLKQLAQKLEQWMPAGSAAARGVQRETGLRSFARSPAASVVDPATLAEISGGDAAMERDLLARFRRYNTEDGHLLMNAVERREMADVAQASHRIKGASKTIGAMALAAVCDRLERASRANDWPAVEWEMDDFRREFDLLDAFIAGFVDAPPAPTPLEASVSGTEAR